MNIRPTRLSIKPTLLVAGSLFALTLAACGIPPTEACDKYVACAEYYDNTLQTGQTTDTTAFQLGGSCWETAESADACNTSCIDATSTLADALEAAGEDLGDCG